MKYNVKFPVHHRIQRCSNSCTQKLSAGGRNNRIFMCLLVRGISTKRIALVQDCDNSKKNL